MSAIKPTPQESFSWRGSNRPLAAGTCRHNGNSTGESLTARYAREALPPTSNRCVVIVDLMVSGVGLAHLPCSRHDPRCKSNLPVRGGLCRSPVPHGTACRFL